MKSYFPTRELFILYKGDRYTTTDVAPFPTGVTVDGFTTCPNSTLAEKTEMWHVAIRLGLQTVACLEAK